MIIVLNFFMVWTNVRWVCPFQHTNWVLVLIFFFNLDVGYEHEHSNPLEMDISSRFI